MSSITNTSPFPPEIWAKIFECNEKNEFSKTSSVCRLFQSILVDDKYKALSSKNSFGKSNLFGGLHEFPQMWNALTSAKLDFICDGFLGPERLGNEMIYDGKLLRVDNIPFNGNKWIGSSSCDSIGNYAIFRGLKGWSAVDLKDSEKKVIWANQTSKIQPLKFCLNRSAHLKFHELTPSSFLLFDADAIHERKQCIEICLGELSETGFEIKKKAIVELDFEGFSYKNSCVKDNHFILLLDKISDRSEITFLDFDLTKENSSFKKCSMHVDNIKVINNIFYIEKNGMLVCCNLNDAKDGLVSIWEKDLNKNNWIISQDAVYGAYRKTDHYVIFNLTSGKEIYSVECNKPLDNQKEKIYFNKEIILNIHDNALKIWHFPTKKYLEEYQLSKDIEIKGNLIIQDVQLFPNTCDIYLRTMYEPFTVKLNHYKLRLQSQSEKQNKNITKKSIQNIVVEIPKPTIVELPKQSKNTIELQNDSIVDYEKIVGYVISFFKTIFKKSE